MDIPIDCQDWSWIVRFLTRSRPGLTELRINVDAFDPKDLRGILLLAPQLENLTMLTGVEVRSELVELARRMGAVVNGDKICPTFVRFGSPPHATTATILFTVGAKGNQRRFSTYLGLRKIYQRNFVPELNSLLYICPHSWLVFLISFQVEDKNCVQILYRHIYHGFSIWTTKVVLEMSETEDGIVLPIRQRSMAAANAQAQTSSLPTTMALRTLDEIECELEKDTPLNDILKDE